MNRLIHIAAGSALLVFSAAAQDTETNAKLKAEKVRADIETTVQMKMMGAVKGTAVKGAPYSADEVNETNQTLADGTRIHRETRTAVFRDSEGRVRRETPENIMITDPVANVTYILNPKSMTGQKLTMAAGNFVYLRSGSLGGTVGAPPGSYHTMPDTSTFTFSTTGDGPANIIVNGQKLDEKAVAEAMAKAKESGRTITYERRVSVSGDEPISVGGGTGGSIASGWTMASPAGVVRRAGPGEPLGKQMIEGVNAEGTRHVSTLAPGDIGNDRPIQITSESWYSQELQIPVMTKHSDPRTGEESFRITNIHRGEPGAYLFQPPAGYQINERK